ncbi:hypothetical protein STAL104432_25800 [Streptomyces albus]
MLSGVRPVDVHLQVDQLGVGLGQQHVVEADVRLVLGEAEFHLVVVLVELQSAGAGRRAVGVEVLGGALPRVHGAAVAVRARRGAHVREAEGRRVVDDLLQLGGEGVGGRVGGPVADVAADAAQAVVPHQPFEAAQRDLAGALGVPGELHRVVPVALQCPEDGGEAQLLDLVADGVQLDAQFAAGHDRAVPVRLPGGRARGGGRRAGAEEGRGRGAGGDAEEAAAAQLAVEFGVLGVCGSHQASPSARSRSRRFTSVAGNGSRDARASGREQSRTGPSSVRSGSRPWLPRIGEGSRGTTAMR